MNNTVENWFGDNFKELDPLLQKLHIEGGALSGVVDLTHGKGLAGLLGRRLASQLGLPIKAGAVDFKVEIKHSKDRLFWNRTFGVDHKLSSIFVPHGNYPDGYWKESLGKLNLELGVDIVNGGWYWTQRNVKFFGIRLPLWLFPRSRAYKNIVDGQYYFSVTFTLPLIGKILSYNGTLNAQTS